MAFTGLTQVASNALVAGLGDLTAATEIAPMLTGSATITLTNKTLTTPTITNPTVTTGTFATPALTTPTVATTLTLNDACNIVINATTGSKIGTATTQKIGFYNVTPVVQPAASADVTGFAAGSGTASKSDSVWAGASGSSTYTVGGIVTALKALGLLAA